MNTSGLFIAVLINIILLITHSYFKRGFRLTFNFFLFSFIAAARKEVGSFFGPFSQGSPFFFPDTKMPFIVSFVTVLLGWMFTFYISWSISEKIVARFKYFGGKIFPTILFSGMLAASISYAVETIGVQAGWWHWKFADVRLSGILVGGAHFFAIEAWFYFAVHFLAAFFLIECSRFSKYGWKYLFLLIYFARTWSILSFDGSVIRLAEERIMFCLLIIFSFFLPLKFEYPNPGLKEKAAPLPKNLIKIIPYLVSFTLLSILFFLGAIKTGNIQIAVSSLPFFVLLLLAIRKINFMFLTLFSLCLLVFWGKIMIPVVLPVAGFIIFKLFDRLPEKASVKAQC